MQYSDNGIPSERNPALEYKARYWLLIDLGAYRTTVLCWPNNKDLRDVSVLSEFLVSLPGSKEVGFPSAFMKKNRIFSFLSDSAMEDIPKGDFIESAKSYFAEEYSAHQDAAEEFTHYVKNLLSSVLTIITKPDTRSIWNYKEIPVIEGLKLTVPDLFIENLRDGYCDIIKKVCAQLRRENTDWALMMPDRFFDDDKTDFVQISADENGAVELYFMHNVQTLPFLNLSHAKDRSRNLPDAQGFFQTLESTIDAGEKKQLVLACCVIDIGGLTTDASTTVLKFVPNQKIADLEAHMLMKTSFSEPKAGKHLKEEYQNFRGRNQHEWWDNAQFLAANEVSFLRIIIQEQYRAIQAWQEAVANRPRDHEPLDGVYFILAGRPTQSQEVQKLLSNLISETFNQDDLLIMKEHCLFMSEFPHIWRDGNTRRAKRNTELAKLVTVVGNLFSLELNYSVDEKLMCYYIQVQLDQQHDNTFELKAGESKSLDEYDFFLNLMNANPFRKLKLEFSKQKNGKYQQFLSVAGRLQRNSSASPRLRIGSPNKKEEYQEKRWILPSIYVENLDEQRELELFELSWGKNAED